MPNILTLADVVLQRIIWRRATNEAYHDYVSHSLAIAMRYIRMFYPAVVIVALMAMSHVSMAYADDTNICTYGIQGDYVHCGSVTGWPVHIEEDSPQWVCTSMGNMRCGPGYPYVAQW